MALACGLAVYPAVTAGVFLPAAALLGATAVAAVSLAVFRPRPFTGVALFLFALHFLAGDLSGRVAAIAVVPYAVGLLVTCELLLWSGRGAGRGGVARVAVLGWVATLALTAAGGGALAAMVWAAGGSLSGAGTTALLVGAVSAAALMSIPLALVRFRPQDRASNRASGAGGE